MRVGVCEPKQFSSSCVTTLFSWSHVSLEPKTPLELVPSSSKRRK
jgi:hypothetical protein